MKRSSTHITTLFLVISVLQICPAVFEAAADCTSNCQKLKHSEIIGIKSTKQYLKRRTQLKIFSNSRKAEKQRYGKFSSCENSSLLKKTESTCAPAFGITESLLYLCTKQLKPLKTEAQAIAKGYSAYTACSSSTPTPTPSATATPVVTPKPSTLTFSIEAGSRLSDVDAVAVQKLDTGNYTTYSAASITTDLPDTIRYAQSADGLNFGSKSAIGGISPDASETFANPTTCLLQNGSRLMIYEELQHVSSAGVDIHRVMRAVSPDGVTFSNDPSTVAIPNGSLISSYFYPSLLKLNGTSLQLYYMYQSDMKTIQSNDEGINWGTEEAVSILGRNDSFAPYPSQPAVIKTSNDKYLLFFVSSLTTEDSRQTIFLADSTDGKTFYVFDSPVLSPPASTSYIDPSPQILSDGSIRLYFLEQAGDVGSITRTFKSALSQL